MDCRTCSALAKYSPASTRTTTTPGTVVASGCRAASTQPVPVLASAATCGRELR